MKGMSLDECMNLAERFISEQGACLFLFDVVGSKNFIDRRVLNQTLLSMMHDLNTRFGQYFPENVLSISSRERGFHVLLGDGSWTCINSEKAIPEIIEYQRTNYPDVPLYWGVARDDFDEERTKMVR